jgi:hypothetical protein
MSAGNHPGRDATAPGLARLESRIRARLSRLGSENLLRSLVPPAGIDLASNDYLNLSTHPEIVEQFAASVRAEGCGSTGSRLLRGERRFAAIERRFAMFGASQPAFRVGYLANIGVLATLPQDGDVVQSDEQVSLIDGMRLSRHVQIFRTTTQIAIRRQGRPGGRERRCSLPRRRITLQHGRRPGAARQYRDLSSARRGADRGRSACRGDLRRARDRSY